MIRICSLLCCSRPSLSGEPADWIWTGRYVVTMDPQRRVIENGAIAIQGERSSAVGTRAEIDKPISSQAAPGPAECDPGAWAHRYAHACSDVAVPRDRRR